jgi:hypothetical protein
LQVPDSSWQGGLKHLQEVEMKILTYSLTYFNHQASNLGVRNILSTRHKKEALVILIERKA